MLAPICVVIECESDVGEVPVPVSAQEVGSEAGESGVAASFARFKSVVTTQDAATSEEPTEERGRERERRGRNI